MGITLLQGPSDCKGGSEEGRRSSGRVGRKSGESGDLRTQEGRAAASLLTVVVPAPGILPGAQQVFAQLLLHKRT